ncbi:hypothetical protein TNCV_835221 [Trichonephila clavipes]|nr:hypothetical protein TNCV_835221 [Trichonephila clavipes]
MIYACASTHVLELAHFPFLITMRTTYKSKLSDETTHREPRPTVPSGPWALRLSRPTPARGLNPEPEAWKRDTLPLSHWATIYEAGPRFS